MVVVSAIHGRCRHELPEGIAEILMRMRWSHREGMVGLIRPEACRFLQLIPKWPTVDLLELSTIFFSPYSTSSWEERLIRPFDSICCPHHILRSLRLHAVRRRCLLLQMSHVAWSVCLWRVLGTRVSCAEKAEPIEMPFGRMTDSRISRELY